MEPEEAQSKKADLAIDVDEAHYRIDEVRPLGAVARQALSAQGKAITTAIARQRARMAYRIACTLMYS